MATKKKVVENSPEKTYVMVRSRAGVHFGSLKKKTKNSVILNNARNLFHWQGANSLRAVVNDGVNMTSFTKITQAVTEVEIFELLEIINMTPVQFKRLDVYVWNN